MNRHFFKYLSIVAIVVSATSTSCKKDEPKLTLGSEIVEFTAIPTDAKTVNIQSRIEWSVVIEQMGDWLSVMPMSGNGNATLTITAQDNDNFEEQRNATITITGEGVQAKTIAVTQKSAVILLENFSHAAHHNNSTYEVFEYDAQNRITKRLRYRSTLYEAYTLTYNAYGDLVKMVEEVTATTTTFTRKDNKISYIEWGTPVEIELNTQELPVKKTYLRESEISNLDERTSTFTWENGNLIQVYHEYYINEEYNYSVTYTYDNKKSPFFYCATPKWFLLCWHMLGIGYCSENNVETVKHSQNSTETIIISENTYNDDGFLASQSGWDVVIGKWYEYMKR